MLIFFSRIALMVIYAYLLLLTIRILLSWINLPPMKWLYWVYRLTDPVIEYFKKNFPIKIAFFDLSIMIPIIILMLAGKIIDDLIIQEIPVSIYYFLALIVLIINWAYSFITFVIVILAVILLFLETNAGYTYHPIVNSIRKLLYPVIYFIKKYIKISSHNAQRIYILIIIGLVVILGFVGNNLLMSLYYYLMRFKIK
jgi:uncharacterized protein YggT (Ycf19 family)